MKSTVFSTGFSVSSLRTTTILKFSSTKGNEKTIYHCDFRKMNFAKFREDLQLSMEQKQSSEGVL